MKIISLIIILLFLVSCASQTEVSTTKLATTSSTSTTSTTTTTTSTTSTTTTTFLVPPNGKMCADIYSSALNNVCGNGNVKFFITAPGTSECHLGAQYGTEDVLYIEVKNYNKAPFAGLKPSRMPIFAMSSNLGINETGDISARYMVDTINEITFIRNNYYIEINTWTKNREITCNSEQTLAIAKVIDRNILNFDS